MECLGIDIGGSGIKGALVDCTNGSLLSERVRLATPCGFEPGAVSETVAELARQFDHRGPIGVGFPAALAQGMVLTAPTAHEVPGWRGQNINSLFSQATGNAVFTLNDADAAGLAEMHFGAGRGCNGVVITITLGTGVGGGLFNDGILVPNLEIGKLYLAGHSQVVEQFIASRIRKEDSLSWKKYRKRMRKFLRHVEFLLSPERIIIGGGISRRFDKFIRPDTLDRSEVVPARLLNQAGIIGAASWAAASAGNKPV